MNFHLKWRQLHWKAQVWSNRLKLSQQEYYNSNSILREMLHYRTSNLSNWVDSVHYMQRREYPSSELAHFNFFFCHYTFLIRFSLTILFSWMSECGKTLQEPSGTFASPGFPRTLPNKVCDWRISMTPGERISLNFTAFDLRRTSSKCKDEYLEVRDGHSRTSPLIGKYCGRRKPPSIWSSGSRMWIRYSSGQTATRQGFKATYRGLIYFFPRQAKIILNLSSA